MTKNFVLSDNTQISSKIASREWVAVICDVIEDLLDEHDITIPDSDRTEDESEARLYGQAYDQASEAIQKILEKLTGEIKRNPDAEFDFSMY